MLATMTTTTMTKKKSNKVYMGLPEVLCLSALPSSSVLLILVWTHDSVLSGSLILTPSLGTPSFLFFFFFLLTFLDQLQYDGFPFMLLYFIFLCFFLLFPRYLFSYNNRQKQSGSKWEKWWEEKFGGGDGGGTVFRLHCLKKESMFNKEGIKEGKTNKKRKMIFKSYYLKNV